VSELDKALGLGGADWPADVEESYTNGDQGSRLHRIDLGDLVEKPHERPKLHMETIYPAKLQVVGGEPGHGKSTVLAWWLLRAIERGHNVALFDWEAGADHTSDLLQSKGADQAQDSKHLHYYPYPDLHWTPPDVAEVAAELRGLKPVITGFDSSIAILSAMGGNENNPADVRRMWTTLAPIARRLGCAVIATDHSGKDAAESRYNRGSTDKLAAVDVSWKLNAVEQFSRHRDGHLELSCTKDRPGWLHWHWDIHVTRDPLTLHWAQGEGRRAAAGEDIPGAEGMPPARAKLYAVLNTEPVTVERLVDRMRARFGHGLKRQTASTELNELARTGHAERYEQGTGLPALWAVPAWGPEPTEPEPATGPVPG